MAATYFGRMSQRARRCPTLLQGALTTLAILSATEALAQTPVPAQLIPGAQRGGMCFTNHSRMKDADVPWNCEHIGKVTIRQIYERGFRVIGSYSTDLTEKPTQFPFLIIEEQRK